MSAINIKRLKSGEDLIFIVKHGNESIEINEETGEHLLFFSIPFSKFVKRKYIKLF